MILNDTNEGLYEKSLQGKEGNFGVNAEIIKKGDDMNNNFEDFENEIEEYACEINNNLFDSGETFDRVIKDVKTYFENKKIPFNSKTLSKLFEETMFLFNDTIRYRLEEQDEFIDDLKKSKLINEDDFTDIKDFDDYR
jgi:hypothetical protein